MLAKAAGLPADEVFLDLEDAVAPSLKNDDTRAAIVARCATRRGSRDARRPRQRASAQVWCLDDLAAIVGRRRRDASTA